eukprot:12716230-Heterocapsa_arctica.AAC.1
MEWQARRKSGFGTNAVHRNSWNFGSWQEGHKTRYGSEGSIFLLQWEVKHDQTNGVRIGEARIPGHSGAAQKEEKTWTGLMANIN